MAKGRLAGLLAAMMGGQSVAAAGFDCLIEPAQMVELSSPVTGLLERVTVRRGDKVARGQLLAALESTAEQASAELARYKSEQVGPSRLAEAKIEFSGRKFNRRRDMAADKLLSAQDRDDAEAEYKQAQAELQVARENREAARLEYRQQSGLLNLRSIRSPFDGVVVDQLAYPGEVVEPGAGKRAILKLAQLDPLRIRVILPMSAFGKPAVGMAASVVPELQGRGSYAAKVRMVDRIIDAASGTFVVFLDMPNPRLDIPS
ncbi:efflux RND transporter periplasmic adaptor subunit, partial [Chitinimonas koreensis]|uniref:efflux RND transporter periplasmic adaptor subunit n=1 Tax=Chitinimonas koreensis TaxID=356302 RepID=UPI00146FB1EE